MLRGRISISLRLTLWFGAIFFFGWMLFGTAMGFTLKSTLTGERHQTLARRLDRLQDLLRRNQGASDADRAQDFADFAHATGNGLAEVFRPDGTRAYPAPSSAAAAFPWPAIATASPGASSGIRPERFLHADYAGQSYWVMLRPFSLRGETVILVVAAPETGNLLLLHNFWRGLLAAAPILLLVSCASGYWVSRKALQPVDRITATARSISIRNLSERLPVAPTGDELQRLAETCNSMLARLESAVNQIKQFTTDASHELRGPLSFTRTVAEVALRNPSADPESRKAFAEIVDETAKAAVLLEQMLTLARADSELFSDGLQPVNLADVVHEACNVARPLADKHQLSLSVSCPDTSPAQVLGDFASLRRLLWILLDNALKYTGAPGQIEVALRTGPSHATLLVRDTGIGIAASDLPHIFDRFYRADPSRSDVEGSGLGLAIAQWIAELHHADLSVASQPHHGTTFQLVVPLCKP